MIFCTEPFKAQSEMLNTHMPQILQKAYQVAQG